MSLRRQLIIIIVALFHLLFAGTFAINVHSTRDYLNGQLRNISQDMATSLGLTLSPHMAEQDLAVVESMIDAVFDSGYYRAVVLSDVSGKTMIEREQPVTIEQAPAWFVKLVPLETPQGEALIMAGWQQAGSIRISANPGIAYATLWSSSVQSFFWFLASSLVVLGLGVIALYYVLRPLRAVEEQAMDIAERKYTVQDKLPRSPELRNVVVAMNGMAQKLERIFSEQEVALDRMRADAYRDVTTGLANRSYFTMQLRYLIETSRSLERGALIMLEVSHFKSLNERLGYQAGDQLLQAIADMIQERLEQTVPQEGFAARLSGTNFAVVIANIDETEAQEFAESLARDMPALQSRGLTDMSEVGHIGVAMYRNQGMQQWLSEADMALRAAQLKGENAVHRHFVSANGDFDTLTATQWINLLRTAVEKRRSTLLLQSTVQTDDAGAVMHNEVLLRISGDDGKLIPAGIFIPMVHRHGLTRAFDCMVIADVMQRLQGDAQNVGNIAVNLLPASIGDPEFVEWVHAQLTANPAVAARLSFETSDYAVTQNLPAFQAWIRRIAPTGAKIGIDQFGKGFASIKHLNSLDLAYVKIDGSFIRNIDKIRDNQLFVESLVNIAHGQDIAVIAEAVENENELRTVRRLRVDGVRGYGIHMPEVWQNPSARVQQPVPK